MEPIRVLVVDDASFMRDMMRKTLRAGFPGFRLEEASHGRQAQQMLQKTRYDLVLCDWEMPELNGAELLGWLRAEPSLAETPFIMVTSRGDKSHVMQAIELKADNYVVKPYTAEKLIGVVGKVVGKAKGLSMQQLRALGTDGARMPGGVGLSGAVPIAATLTSAAAPAPEQAPVTVQVKEKLLAQLRFAGTAIPCLLKAIGRERVQGVIRRESQLPPILDSVVLDLELNGEVARLNGFVCLLEAREERRETEFVNITIALVDQDDREKMGFVDKLMGVLG